MAARLAPGVHGLPRQPLLAFVPVLAARFGLGSMNLLVEETS